MIPTTAKGDLQLAGYVELRDATATLKNFRFAVPGASAELRGTYNLKIGLSIGTARCEPKRNLQI
jgi:hypothetical protein